MDALESAGADLVYNKALDLHASGHAYQYELMTMLSLVKPKYFIPANGEVRHLKQHAALAKQMGMNTEHILMLSNGNPAELMENSCRQWPRVASGNIMIDETGKVMSNL